MEVQDKTPLLRVEWDLMESVSDVCPEHCSRGLGVGAHKEKDVLNEIESGGEDDPFALSDGAVDAGAAHVPNEPVLGASIGSNFGD